MADDRLPACFDPYLRYAISTGFINFASFGREDLVLLLLVELKDVKLSADFEKRLQEFGAELGPDVGRTRYVTVRAPTRAVVDPGALSVWIDCVSRVELSLPLRPVPLGLFIRRTITDRYEVGSSGPGALLIGVLDDGCPFAAAHFLKTSGGSIGTRVRAIWDQNQWDRDRNDRHPIDVIDKFGNPRKFGQRLADFDYGIEFHRDFAAIGKPMGLDEWIQLHSTAGVIDEDGCYADAKFDTLRHRRSHGAHVMDAVAGRMPISSRIGPSPGDRRDPPNWKSGTDPASEADVVFVQFPADCIRDATGVWLKAYVVQGIQYILSFAHPRNTRKVVINVSYGPTTGPHDGTAELEQALSALVAEYDGVTKTPRLEIVLAAGNNYLIDGHVAFTRCGAQPDRVEWTWRLPPDNSVPCFAEIWMRTPDASGVEVTLRSPSGKNYSSSPGGATPVSPAGVDVPIHWGTNTMWRLQVEPTRMPPVTVFAEHGDWTITVTGIGENAPLDAYVARSDPNMGVRTGARRSYFIDHEWERTRSGEASCDYVDGEFGSNGSLIQRHGTLNGIATATKTNLHVPGGYILSIGRKSSYSSAGPARGTPAGRNGPDFVLPCDDSPGLKGIRAGGNRSGAVFRLTGTSVAAPQLARHLAGSTFPEAIDIPDTPKETQKRGGGNLPPP